MRIGIIGSGLMGGKLGTLLARAGHEVTFSYARSGLKLARLARRAGRSAHSGTVREAVQRAETVLLAVHWSRLRDVLGQAGDLSGKVVVTCSLPMNAADTELLIGRNSSGAERLARLIPRARVVSAFGTVPSEALYTVYARRRRQVRPSLAYCGDDRRAKRVVARLVRELGFEPWDAGPLRMARYCEPFTMLIAQFAYGGRGGPRLTYRFERWR